MFTILLITISIYLTVFTFFIQKLLLDMIYPKKKKLPGKRPDIRKEISLRLKPSRKQFIKLKEAASSPPDCRPGHMA